MKTRFSLLGALSVLSLSITLLPAFTTRSAQPIRVRPPHVAETVAGEVIVLLQNDRSESIAQALAAVRSQLGVNSVSSVRKFMTDSRLFNVRLADNGQVGRAISALQTVSVVSMAEPNFRYHAYSMGLPNDPDFSKSWSLQNTGQIDQDKQVGLAGADIHVVPLWQEGLHGTKKTLVAVIDTGIDWTHPDLKANLYTNPGEAGSKATNKKDDDGNGFIDDVHGFNFVDHTALSMDDHDHGSHCAGVIGGVGNNGKGIAGINWSVSLLPVKFLDADGGGSMEGAVEAINYAKLMKAQIMSNSWGGSEYSAILEAAVKATETAGAVFVAAAGNDSLSNDLTPAYPASYVTENMIAVAATDNRDHIAKFSNFGKKTVHIAAPGVDIYSTVRKGKYDTMSGTSMATPHVAGVAALLMSAYPGLTYADVKKRLMDSSDYLPGLRSKVGAKGRLNAFGALHGIVTKRPPEPLETAWKDTPYPLESDHPYGVNKELTYVINHLGAKYIRVHFEKVDVEANYDMITVEDPTGEAIDSLTGTLTDYTTEYLEGDTVTIRLKSDSINDGYGFKIDRIQTITEGDVP